MAKSIFFDPLMAGRSGTWPGKEQHVQSEADLAKYVLETGDYVSSSEYEAIQSATQAVWQRLQTQKKQYQNIIAKAHAGSDAF